MVPCCYCCVGVDGEHSRLLLVHPLLLPILPTQVREVSQQYTTQAFRWQAQAILALQEATEAYLVGLLEDAYVQLFVLAMGGALTV